MRLSFDEKKKQLSRPESSETHFDLSASWRNVPSGRYFGSENVGLKYANKYASKQRLLN